MKISIHKKIPVFVTACVLTLGIGNATQAQALPDTTHLLEQAGVTQRAAKAQMQAIAPQKPEEPQSAYELPFAGKGNTLELVVANTTGRPLENISVAVKALPDWIMLEETDHRISGLKPGEEATLRFGFDVSEQAPVGQAESLAIKVLSENGVLFSKSLKLRVAAPEKFELFPNYPNPFNPSTTITYRLPEQMRVTVEVYNILGRKVVTLADGIQPAGSQTLRWEASRMASGIYLYRVVAEAENGKKLIQNKKMMLIK